MRVISQLMCSRKQQEAASVKMEIISNMPETLGLFCFEKDSSCFRVTVVWFCIVALWVAVCNVSLLFLPRLADQRQN